MTSVFVLSGLLEYEGGDVLGVFADVVSAEMASAKFQGDYDDFEILEWQVESGPTPLDQAKLRAATPFGWAKAG